MSNKISDFAEFAPLNGNKPDKLVIFLHGYGANGQNLIGLAAEFSRVLPNAHFLSPDAPFAFEGMSFEGRQWFSLISYDPQILYPQIILANNILDEFIKNQLNRFSLTRKDLIVVGFSQGSMMAMYNSLRNKEEVKGILAYSGKLILPTSLGEKINSGPKICLIHGTDDQVVPHDHMLSAADSLRNLKIPFESHSISGLDHSIDLNGIRIGQEFLRQLV